MAKAKAKKAKAQAEQGGKFRVLKGFHIVDGKPMGKGSIIESEQDLEARYREERKFKRVTDSSLQSADDEDDDDDEEVEVTAASKAAAKKNPKGGHNRSMGAMVDDDEEDEDDEEAEEEEDDEEVVEASAQSDDEEEEEEESDEEDEEEGEDVTADFKKEAKAAGATVTKRGRIFSLTDKKGKTIGNKKGYTKKADVTKALKKAAK